MRLLLFLLVVVVLFLPSSDGLADVASSSSVISLTVVADATFYFEDGQVVGVESTSLSKEEVAGLFLESVPHLDESGEVEFYTSTPISIERTEELLAMGMLKGYEEEAFLAAHEEVRKKIEAAGSAGDTP